MRRRGVDLYRTACRAWEPVCLSETARFVVFRLDERRFALPLEAVERLVRAVDVTPLPGAPAIVVGAISVHGCLLPVLNIRRRFLVQEREIQPSDWFLLARAAPHMVVLAIDQSDGVIERPQAEIVESLRIVSGLEYFPGVVRLDDGLVLIHDLDTFLSTEEALAMDRALGERQGAVGP